MPTSENPGGVVPGEYSVDDENQLQPEDTLIDRGTGDVLDEGYSPPERPLGLEPHDTLDERLAEEVPEIEPDDGAGDGFASAGGEAGEERAGRLVAPDEGVGEDTEKDLVAGDAGIDGAAASAEEAAVHVIEDDSPQAPGQV